MPARFITFYSITYDLSVVGSLSNTILKRNIFPIQFMVTLAFRAKNGKRKRQHSFAQASFYGIV